MLFQFSATLYPSPTTYNYLLKWLLPLFLVVHLLEIFTPFAQQGIHVSSNKKGAIIQSLIWDAAYWLPDYKKLGY